MKRRSGRNPINFVHAIHICNFVFAIQSRRHATRNRFPLDSSNGYVYFSLLSPAPASSTVSSSSPPRRSPTLRFTSDDSQFLFQWLHLQFPWEREREKETAVSALAPPPYTILSNTFSPLRTRNTFQYLDVSSCSSLVCFFFFLMEKWKENWRGWYEILRDTFNSFFFFFFCIPGNFEGFFKCLNGTNGFGDGWRIIRDYILRCLLYVLCSKANFFICRWRKYRIVKRIIMKTIGYDNLEYLEIFSNNEKRKKKQKLEIGQFNSNSIVNFISQACSFITIMIIIIRIHNLFRNLP